MDRNKLLIIPTLALLLCAGVFIYANKDRGEAPSDGVGIPSTSDTVADPIVSGGDPIPNTSEEPDEAPNPASPKPSSPATSTPSTPTTPTTPAPSGSAEVIRKVATSRKVTVLTFDAGADRGFTSEILDTLKNSGIKATFGMTGKWAEANPDLVKRIASEGHDFINHTYSHGSFTGYSTNSSPLSQSARYSELDRTEKIIKDLTGKTTLPYFRPPYGDYDAPVNKDIFSRGYKFNIMWTVDSLGWKGLSKEEIAARIVNGTVPGAIHLMHVGEQSQDAAALPLVISQLRAKGYDFARISDLVK